MYTYLQTRPHLRSSFALHTADRPARRAFSRKSSWPWRAAQDVRGTGDSEPGRWDFAVYEEEDGIDFVEWLSRQEWCNGTTGSLGGSYEGAMQWCMGMHPHMTAIMPEVGDLGEQRFHGVRPHMFVADFSQTYGANKADPARDELERRTRGALRDSGLFNDPLEAPIAPMLAQRYPTLRDLRPARARRWAWEQYCALGSARRAELFRLVLDAEGPTLAGTYELTRTAFPHYVPLQSYFLPSLDAAEPYRRLSSTPLIVTGWYDWNLAVTLASWRLLTADANETIRANARLIIGPSAHGAPGYHESAAAHPELLSTLRTGRNTDLLLCWYETVRLGTYGRVPRVTYYLMGANEWRGTDEWPPLDALPTNLYLRSDGLLAVDAPTDPCEPDQYDYDPLDPTPTVGGAILRVPVAYSRPYIWQVAWT